VEFAMRPLFAYLRALPVPTGVFAASEDWAGGGDSALIGRVDRAAAELADSLTGRPAANRPVDPFADPTTSFAAVLSGAAGVTQR
jgi:FMN reductase